jgi:simple sugar transport system substrate-binding protein
MQRVLRSKLRIGTACGAVAAVTIMLAACSSSGGAASTSSASVNSSASAGVVYVIGYQQNNAFWATEGKGAEQAGKTLGVTVRYEAPSTSSDAGMISLIDAAIAAKPYGIAIDYTDKTMEAPVERALAAGIKVVLYNNDRFEAQAGGATTDPAVTNLAFVGQDEHLSGSVLGKAFLSDLPGHGTVLIVNPFAEAFVLTLRYDGVNSVLQQAGYKTDLLVVNGNDPEASVEATIGAYLQAHKGIVGVVGLGDPAASPATRYIEQHGTNIPVATFDIDTETYDLMKAKGAEKLALDQQPFLRGYYAVQNLAFELKYGFQPVSVNTGTFLVTPSNISLVGRLVSQGWD